MTDSTFDIEAFFQNYSRGSGRRRQCDQGTEDASRYRQGDSSNAVFPSFQLNTGANVGTGLVPPGDTDLGYYSDSQPLFSSTQDLVAGVNTQPGNVYSGAQSTNPNAQDCVEPATDRSIEGFHEGLREEGIAFGAIDSGQGDLVGSMPSGYNEFATTQDFGPNIGSSWDFGQSSLDYGSYDDGSAAYRQSLGAASSSYLTVPSSVGTGSHTTSDVFSDKESNIFPPGPFDAKSYSGYPSQPENASLSRNVGPRQRSASSAMISAHRPSLWNSHSHSTSNLYPASGNNLPRVGNSQTVAPSASGHNDFLQTPPTSLMPPGPEDMFRMSASDLSLGTQSFTASETSCVSSAALRHRSFSASSRPTLTQDARVTRHPTSGRSSRHITTSRSPNRGRGAIGDDSFSRKSSLRKGKEKGKRCGPMDEENNRTANERREAQDACQSCKFKKTKCVKQQGATCESCTKKGLHCVPYHFKRYRTKEFFDFIARSYFNHVCDRGRSRRWVRMESIHSFNSLLWRVEAAEYIRFVRCGRGGRLLYTIDMQRCAALLRDLASASDPLQAFGKSLDDTISSGDPWLQFHDDLSSLDKSLHAIHRMLMCTELMPWHTFYVLDHPYSSTTERPLDPSEDNDLRVLHAGTLLSRLITTRLEQAGFEQLHRKLTDTKEKPSQPAIGLLKPLLLSLRRRWCMWEQLPSLEDKADWSRRVHRTIEILYFHYFNAIDQPPSTVSSRHPEYMRQTVWQNLFPLSMQISQAPQEEDVPTDNSPEGFDQWLRGGFRYIQWHDIQLDHFFQIEPRAADDSLQYGGSFYA